MKHAIKNWKHISKRLQGKTVLLFLDFDGTLAPIAAVPDKARLSSQTRILLKRLHSLPGIRLTIISGRNLDDIQNRVAIPGIIYAGNHGCRISGPNIYWRHVFSAAKRRKLRELREELSGSLKGIREVLIENKAESVAVHYRNVKNKDMAIFREVLAGISRPYIASSCVNASIGKKVVELDLSTTWNKGMAVNWLMHKLKTLRTVQSCVPIYVGDDLTDETAFNTLKHKGITIHVGSGKQSTASYYLRNPSEVSDFLRKLSALHDPDNSGCTRPRSSDRSKS